MKKALKSIVILVDTREKNGNTYGRHWIVLGCPYASKKLDFGDYSYKYVRPDGTETDCSGSVAIERKKANLDEICGNQLQEEMEEGG